MFKENTLNIKNLPKRLVASTPWFRKEAGSYGKDTKGMLRQHQFYKVELVSIVEPNKCNEELNRMISCAEEILKRLKQPYRQVLLCTGDIGGGICGCLPGPFCCWFGLLVTIALLSSRSYVSFTISNFIL